MQFRTEVQPGPLPALDHSHRVLMLGSCFSENIGRWMQRSGFDCVINPLGILFHPNAMARAINRALTDDWFGPDDAVLSQDRWYVWDAHGRISADSREAVLEEANAGLEALRTRLLNATHVYFTFGTAWEWCLAQDQRPVANCHKISAAQFQRRLTPLESLEAVWNPILSSLRQRNPELAVVFTVSPVRHTRDGLEQNAVSKAILRLLSHHLTAIPGCAYFPAFEIMMDDLRDYRFWKEDMIHPTDQAVEYIWQKFCSAGMSPSRSAVISEFIAYHKLKDHFSQYSGISTHQKKIEGLKADLSKRYPNSRLD
jgi:hypothetical protein